ncbi:MAG: hypothetical protein U1A23_00160 [Candidatus Sungbacteria bacterium]|nr:hypothetical protein [Candidatus Sungbacteria bacterium]
MDTENKSVDKNSVSQSDNKTKFLLSEAYIITFMSGAVYIFVYFFDRSYLSYFGIDAVFIEISTKKLLIVASSVVGAAMIVWNLLYLWPTKLGEYVLMGFYVFLLELLILLIACAAFMGSGVTWLFVILSICGAVLFIWHIFYIFKKGFGAESFRQHLSETVQADEKVRSTFLAASILDRFSPSVSLLILAMVLIPTSAMIFGSIYASWKTSFMTIKTDTSYYIVVGEYQGGLLAAEISDLVLPGYRLSGTIRVFPAESEDTEMVRHKFVDGNTPEERVRVRYSLSDFWQRNFGFSVENRR